MGATAWFYVAFAAVVVMIVATVWGAMVLEAGAAAAGTRAGRGHARR